MASAKCLLPLSVAFALLCVYFVSLFIMLTPVFRPLECNMGETEMSDPDIGDDVKVTGGQSMDCYNPNPTSSKMSMKGTGKVLFRDGDEITDAGVMGMAPVEYAVHGRANGSLWMNVSMSMDEMMQVMGKDIQILTEFTVNTEATVYVFGLPVVDKDEMSMVCGLSVRMSENAFGPSSCAESLELLKLQPVDAETSGPTLLRLPKSKMEEKTFKKNMAVGGAIAVFGGLALGFLVWGLCACKAAPVAAGAEVSPAEKV